MRRRSILFCIVALLGVSVFEPPAQANCMVTGTETFAVGTYIPDDKCDATGAKKATGGGAISSLGTANAAAPSLVEAAQASFSFDLAGNARFTLGTLLSGEDQTNNLLMTSGGAVRQIALMTAVSTNSTGSTAAGYVGSKTVKGTLTCNAGGSTNCGITYTIYGSELSSQATGTKEQLCQVVIPTGAAVTSGSCAPITAAFTYLWAETTGVAGTSPSLNLTLMY